MPQILAQGVTQGWTGDTKRIMQPRRLRVVRATDDAAKVVPLIEVDAYAARSPRRCSRRSSPCDSCRRKSTKVDVRANDGTDVRLPHHAWRAVGRRQAGSEGARHAERRALGPHRLSVSPARRASSLAAFRCSALDSTTSPSMPITRRTASPASTGRPSSSAINRHKSMPCRIAPGVAVTAGRPHIPPVDLTGTHAEHQRSYRAYLPPSPRCSFRGLRTCLRRPPIASASPPR